MEKFLTIKRRLYDGTEQAQRLFVLDRAGTTEIKVSLNDLLDCPLHKLAEQTKAGCLAQVIEKFHVKEVKKLFTRYYDEDGLEVFFYQQRHLFYLIAFGEFQPSRFMVNLLGYFECEVQSAASTKIIGDSTAS